MMKVSIITSAYNNKNTIEECILSVCEQSYKNIEYAIIDNNSKDGTINVINKYKKSIDIFVSESDKGIYYALNKGIRLVTGDIIGFIHADDFYNSKFVIQNVVTNFQKHKVDSCYCDLLYVSKLNTNRIIRYWKAGPYRDGIFRKGWMPPHPTFFVKKDIYEKYGSFNTNFKISADYEFMLRLLEKHKISTFYIPEVVIKMRIGGTSNMSINNIIQKSFEDYKAWKINNLKGGKLAVILKNLIKIPQFWGKKRFEDFMNKVR